MSRRTSSTCREQKSDKSSSARENEKKSHHDSWAKKSDITNASSDPCHMHMVNCIQLQILLAYLVSRATHYIN